MSYKLNYMSCIFQVYILYINIIQTLCVLYFKFMSHLLNCVTCIFKLYVLYISSLYVVNLKCIFCVFKLYQSVGRKLSREIQSKKVKAKCNIRSYFRQVQNQRDLYFLNSQQFIIRFSRCKILNFVKQYTCLKNYIIQFLHVLLKSSYKD